MGFLSETSPQGTSFAPTGSFLKTTAPPTFQSTKEAGANVDAFNAKQASDQANSLGGIAKATVSDIGARVEQYAKDSVATIPSFLHNLAHPLTALDKVTKGFTDPMIAGINKAGEGVAQVAVDPGVANKVAGTAKIISGLAESLFSPISGIFNTAEHLPILKNAADALNVPFKTTGDFSSYLTGKAIDVIPNSILPQESKDIIKTPLKEVGSLAGQILLGGKIMEAVGTKVSGGEVITPEVAKQVVLEAHDEVQKIATQSPEAKHAAYATSQGYEPYTPPGQLPTIDVGPKAKSSLPDIRVGEPSPSTKLGSMTVEPIKPQVPGGFLEKALGTPETPVVSPEVPVPPREPGVTKTASDINQNLVKQGFDALPAEEQAKYTPQSYKEVAAHVASMMDANIEEVKSMATGKTPIPTGINPEILFNAVEAHATETGDVQLLKDLAKSPVSKTSEAGQILGGHGFNDNPNSAVDAIKSVEKARETFAERKVGKVNRAREEIVKTEGKSLSSEIAKEKVVTAKTWGDFIESIKCNY